MIRIGIVILAATLISGCELQQHWRTLVKEPTNTNMGCYINKGRLSGLLQQERSYLTSSNAVRKVVLQRALKAEDYPQAALLLAQPDAQAAELQQALQYFSKQGTNPSFDCPGDRYLTLRHVQTELLLDISNQQFTLEKENQELRKQIEALTQIEQEISRDREIVQ